MKSVKLLILMGFVLKSIIGFTVNKSCVDRVLFFDIGQGDSALIQIECKNILIDGGNTDLILTKLGDYLKPWEFKIDLLVLTHPHSDHMDGLIDVLQRYDVTEVWANPVCYKSESYLVFLKSVLHYSKFRFDITYSLESFRLSLIANNQSYIDMVDDLEVGIDIASYLSEKCSSGYGFFEPQDKNVNNESLIVMLESKSNGYRVLFMGDGEEELEKKILSSELLSEVTVLKAGHHCSKTSTSEQLLEKVKPKLVICSAGKDNMYNHPSPETILKFKKYNIPYYVTYEIGDYIVLLE